MSWETYALHAYAAEVQGLPLRDEIKVLLNGDDEDDEYEERYRDIDDVLDDLHNGCLDGPVYDKLANTDWEIFYGPGVSRYIGYSAVMPYEQPSMTKEEMSKEIYDTLAYLCGEKYAKVNKPEEIYETWIE